MKIIVDQQPDIVFLAPVCGPWSSWSNMMSPLKRDAKRKENMPMLIFVAKVAMNQIAQGKYFVIENPETSAIWNLEVIAKLLQQPGVCWDTFHMCAFGARDPVNHKAWYKPTSLQSHATYVPEMSKHAIQQMCSRTSTA